MTCSHVLSLRTPKGVQRVSLAAESVFTSTSLPYRSSTPPPSLPRCLEPACPTPSSGDVHVCVQCVYSACARPHAPRTSLIPSSPNQPSPLLPPQTHLQLHDNATRHPISLSVTHGRLFCSRCSDYVYDPYLDAAITLQHRIASSHRRNFLTSPSPLDTSSTPPSRSKRRRVTSLAHWVPTAAELALISSSTIAKPRPSAAPVPPVGLYNLGNSCYMNSVLQAFLNAPPLRCYFLGDGHRPSCAVANDCLACALDALVCDAQAGEEAGARRVASGGRGGREADGPSLPVTGSPFLVPHRMLEIMWKHAEHLASYAQHDAHEFLIATLNILNAHCKIKGVTPKVDASAQIDASHPDPVLPRSSDDFIAISPLAPSPVGNILGASGDDPPPAGDGPQRSIVHNLFSGTLQSDVICSVCGNRSPTLEKFYDISLDVDNLLKPPAHRRSRASTPDRATATGTATPAGGSSRAPSVDGDASGVDSAAVGGSESAAVRRGKGAADASDRSFATARSSPKHGGAKADALEKANTLMECLARFTEPEVLGEAAKMFCARCGIRQEAQKQMSIRTLPPVLCFHFKRFEQNFAKIRTKNEMVKIDTPVEFPVDNLDLAPFQTASVVRQRMTAAAAAAAAEDGDGDALMKDFPPSAKSLSSGDDDAVYDLFAVILHVGSIDRGHYTTLVRRRGAWFKCDDDKVTSVPRVGKDIRSGEAYLAFYTQRKPNLMY